MGRPRKRQRTGDSPTKDDVPATRASYDAEAESRPSGRRPHPPPTEPAIDPGLTEKDIERTNFQNICNAPMAKTVKRSAGDSRTAADRTASANNVNGNNLLGSQSSSNTSPYDAPRTPPEGGDIRTFPIDPTDVSQWPDFSDMTMLPIVVQDRNEREKPFHAGEQSPNAHLGQSNTTGSTPYSTYLSGLDTDPSALGQLPTVPSCPCLPNLYLTLSTLSTLSAFPVSSGMIDTLLNAPPHLPFGCLLYRLSSKDAIWVSECVSGHYASHGTGGPLASGEKG